MRTETEGRGVCRMPETPVVARAALHRWEEPPISGTRGAGTVFFSGCSLGCVFCQNDSISQGDFGREIPVERLRDQPRVFSGGMQQRVQISKAIANNPPILLLDEVTTGLDLSVQAKVLDLIRTIQQELGIAMMIVSHDLSVIRMMSDRTMVMLGGRVVEEGLTDQILEDPLHAYTQTLVSSLL